jgi:hypothetical protein
MGNVIQIKHSDTTTNVPSSLAAGELAINRIDKKLFYTDNANAVKSKSLNDTINLHFIIDGGGSALATGVAKGCLKIDFACTIVEVTLLADQSGSVVIDIWKDTYTNYPPTVADTITASAKPTITTATKSQDNTLTGWNKDIAAGDILKFNVDSVTTITNVTVVLKVTKL